MSWFKKIQKYYASGLWTLEMMDFNATKMGLLAVFGAAGGIIASALGGWDILLRALICLMVLDYITGLLVALVWKKSPKTETGAASSSAALKGFLKKGFMLVAVFLAVQMDLVLSMDYLRNTVVLALLANEALSLVENLGIAGVPWPEAVKNAIELLTAKGDAKNGSKGN